MANISNRQELWAKLLSNQRIHGQSFPATENSRSEYQRDYDRVVFSSAFRRLQDKTQVFPLSQTDFTRTRLTHSLEVSSVARTLGLLAAKYLTQLGVDCDPQDLGTILATAGLAHDLGNPPFGHSGEAAIQSWARRRLPMPDSASDSKATLQARRKKAQSILMCREEVADFHQFEGNSQGLRILVRTMARTRKGGMRPTVATLGALAKYPRPSLSPDYEFRADAVSEKKPGYFQNDRVTATRAYRMAGMIEKKTGVFCRHPLAFLGEAADDICYAIADIEDGYKIGAVSFEQVASVLRPLAARDVGFQDALYLDDGSQVARIRASALAVLVSECMGAFRSSLEEMETGRLDVPLLARTKVFSEFGAIKELAKNFVYCHERVLQIEYAGYQTIGGLLEMFYAAVCEPSDDLKDQKLRKLLPPNFLWRPASGGHPSKAKVDSVDCYLKLMTRYERLLAVTDYVSGMTDRFAIQLFQRLSGIRLPE